MLSWPQTMKDFNLYRISRKANYNVIEKYYYLIMMI
jgi:hypothetical protein